MSRATVRTAIQQYLASPQIPFLTTVFIAQPKIIQPTDILVQGTPSGAAGWIHIEREYETRRALGGATSGKKEVNYFIALGLRFRSNRPKAEDAMADYDTLIEGIKTRLRADRTLSSSVIFQAGEAGSGIAVQSDLPHLSTDITVIASAVRFQCSEWINS